jgi:hypothetical protein
MERPIVVIPPDELVIDNEYFFSWKDRENSPLNIRSGKFGGYVTQPEDGFNFKDVRIIRGNNQGQVSNDEFYPANSGPEITFYRYQHDARIDKDIYNSINAAGAPAAGGGKKTKRRKSRYNRKSKRSKKTRHYRKTRYH